jgi:hypothetical protein
VPTSLLRSAVVALASARSPRVRGAERVRAAGLRALLAAAMVRRPLGEVLGLLDAPPGGPPPGADAQLLRALRRWPTSCLYRSLAGYAQLRARGEPVRFVIGIAVEGGALSGHAWLERDGEPLGEPDDPRRRWAVAYTHPARPSQEVSAVLPTSQLRPSPDVLLTELADGSGVLLHLRTKFYYALNRTGVAVWKRLAAGEAATPEALAAAVVAGFQGAEPGRVQADVAALLHELEEEGLLLPPAPAGAR